MTIGMSFVAPRNITIKNTDNAAPAIANHRHHMNGIQMPITASAARKRRPAEATARKNPDIGTPPEAVMTPRGPESPSAHGQNHFNRPKNACWDL